MRFIRHDGRRLGGHGPGQWFACIHQQLSAGSEFFGAPAHGRRLDASELEPARVPTPSTEARAWSAGQQQVRTGFSITAASPATSNFVRSPRRHTIRFSTTLSRLFASRLPLSFFPVLTHPFWSRHFPPHLSGSRRRRPVPGPRSGVTARGTRSAEPLSRPPSLPP